MTAAEWRDVIALPNADGELRAHSRSAARRILAGLPEGDGDEADAGDDGWDWDDDDSDGDVDFGDPVGSYRTDDRRSGLWFVDEPGE